MFTKTYSLFMKQIAWAKLLLLLLMVIVGNVIILCVDAHPTFAQTTSAQATALKTLNVRSGPGTNYAILGQLAVGTTVQVTGQVTGQAGQTGQGNGLWWQIIYPSGSGQSAWISGRADLVQVSHAAQVPVVNVAAPPSAPLSDPTASPIAPPVLSFTITPTSTQNFGDSLRMVWAAQGERASLCRMMKGIFGPCQPVPLQGEMTVITDESMNGVTDFLLQVLVDGHWAGETVEVFLQCQNRYRWFFSHPLVRCARGPAVISPAAFQPFEHGIMLWIDGQPGEEDDIFYVFVNNATQKSSYVSLSGPFIMKPGASKGNLIGQPPPPGFVEPVSGFGQLWRNEFETGNRSYEFRDLRGRLGWALAPEVGYEFAMQCEASSATCYLRFPGDTVLRTVAYKWTPGAGEAEWLIPPVRSQ